MMLYTFHRKEGWYALQLQCDESAIKNAESNPGTLKVVNEETNVTVWESTIRGEEE